jgi:hypothetical protein
MIAGLSDVGGCRLSSDQGHKRIASVAEIDALIE